MPTPSRQAAGGIVPVSTDPGDLESSIGTMSQQLFGKGSALSDAGIKNLQPVLDYFNKLLKGDAGAVDEAASPQIKGIIDAYNASRRSTAQFTPRGGGQASAISASRDKEASDIGTARSSARSSAAGALASIGLDEAQIGTTQQGQGLQGLMNVLQAAITEKGNTQSLWGSIGEGVGSIIGAIFA